MFRASAVLAGAGTVLIWAVTSLGGSLAGWMALCWGARACPGGVSPGAVRQKDLSFFSSKLIRPYRHFPGPTRDRSNVGYRDRAAWWPAWRPRTRASVRPSPEWVNGPQTVPAPPAAYSLASGCRPGVAPGGGGRVELGERRGEHGRVQAQAFGEFARAGRPSDPAAPHLGEVVGTPAVVVARGARPVMAPGP